MTDNKNQSSGERKRVAKAPSQPPLTPIPQLFRKGYEAIIPSKQGDVVVMKKPSPIPPDPVEAYRKSMQWKYWLLGIAGTLIAFGFYTSQHLANYETKVESRRLIEEHSKLHMKLDKHLEELNEKIIDIRLEQVRQAEQAKLIDVRLELFIKLSSQDASTRNTRVQEVETERLKREVRVQQSRLERLESNPRVQRAMPNDALDGLNL